MDVSFFISLSSYLTNKLFLQLSTSIVSIEKGRMKEKRKYFVVFKIRDDHSSFQPLYFIVWYLHMKTRELSIPFENKS